MSDLEEELKRVRLARETLALNRELALNRLVRNLQVVPVRALRFVLSKWRWGVWALLSVGLVAGASFGYDWQQRRQYERAIEERDAWATAKCERAGFHARACTSGVGSNINDYFACQKASMAEWDCRISAMTEYEAAHKK